MLLQMRGIAAGDVKEAAKQVVASLSRFAKSGGKSDPDGPGDLPPNFSYGYMTVNNKRHNAIYRLVNSVYVIVIASPLTPLFSLVKMVDAVTKQLVEACKGPEVTLDKVAKRYAEIYVGIGALLAVGGASLSLAASEASTLMSVMFPEEKKERFGSFSSFSRGKKGDSASGANGVPPLPLRSSQAAGVRRSLVDGVKLGDATVDGPSPPTSSRRGTSRRDSLTPRSASAMGAAAAGAAGWDYGDEEQFTTGTHTPAPSSRPSESGGVDWNAFGPDPSSGGGMSAGVAASSEQDTSFDSVPPSSDSPLFGNTPQWAPQQQARTTATGDVFESDSSFQAFDNNMFNQNNSSVVEDYAWQAFDNSPLQQPPASTANAAYASNNNSFDSEGFASFSAAHNEEAGFATSAADVPNHDFGTFLEPSTANSTAPFTAFGDTAPQGGAITTSAASAAAADSAWGAAGGDDPFLAPGGGDSFNVDDSFFGSGNAGQPPPIAPTAEQSAFGDTSSFFPAAPTPTHAPFFSGGAAVAGFDAFGAGASNASGAFDAPSDVFSQPIAPHVVSPTAVPPVPGGLQLIEVWQASFCGLKLSSTELAAEVQMGAGGSGGACLPTTWPAAARCSHFSSTPSAGPSSRKASASGARGREASPSFRPLIQRRLFCDTFSHQQRHSRLCSFRCRLVHHLTRHLKGMAVRRSRFWFLFSMERRPCCLQTYRMS